MPREKVSIKTADGVCAATVFTPVGKGQWAAVIYYMDALAIRPSVLEMGDRLANAGFVVLIPDLFYRIGHYEPMDPKVVFAQPDIRKTLAHFFASTDNHRAAKDTASFIAYLDTRSDIAGKKIGTVGYCMGGGMAITAAGTYPDRIAAAAAFHAGSLATDTELSPHLLAPKIKARLYIGVADQDHSYPPEMAERFEKALKDASVDYRSELYPGAKHGWTQTDFPIYDKAADEKHWHELIGLFKATLS